MEKYILHSVDYTSNMNSKVSFHLKPICSIWPKKDRATVSYINKFPIYGDNLD